jgi:hypothetical protein
VHDEQIIPPPPPALFHVWKHHARFLCAHIRRLGAGGPAALVQLPSDLLAIGGSQMDLYLGPLTPAAMASALIDHLAAADRLRPERYRAALADGGYLLVDLADRSSWVLRWGDQPGRYVHIHPARYAPQTLRVRAPVLKTAVAALAWAAAHGVALDLDAVNAARAALLGWQPLRSFDASAGCGALLDNLAALLDEESGVGSQESGIGSRETDKDR